MEVFIGRRLSEHLVCNRALAVQDLPGNLEGEIHGGLCVQATAEAKSVCHEFKELSLFQLQRRSPALSGFGLQQIPERQIVLRIHMVITILIWATCSIIL
jgi:hypothetical protein